MAGAVAEERQCFEARLAQNPLPVVREPHRHALRSRWRGIRNRFSRIRPVYFALQSLSMSSAPGLQHWLGRDSHESRSSSLKRGVVGWDRSDNQLYQDADRPRRRVALAPSALLQARSMKWSSTVIPTGPKTSTSWVTHR